MSSPVSPLVRLFKQRALRLLMSESETVEALPPNAFILILNDDRFLVRDV